MNQRCLNKCDNPIAGEQLSESPSAGRKYFDSDFCDLHVHSTASDGQCTPQQVLSLAQKAGLKAISLCDHDTLSGYMELTRQYKAMTDGTVMAFGIEVIPGIEINSEWQGRELHILGYFINPDNREFLRLLAQLRESRLRRLNQILERLANLDISIDISRVLEIAQGESVGRPHVAQALVEEGYANNIREAFELYLGIGKPGYAARSHLNPVESIKAVRRAGGVAVWAHPGTARADNLLGELIEAGLQGLEVCHPEHEHHIQQKYKGIAADNRLIATGGSDFHSLTASEGSMIGSYGVPYDSVRLMKVLSGS